jgi:hypothetical protein
VALVERSNAHHSNNLASTGWESVCSSTGVQMFMFARCQVMCYNFRRRSHNPTVWLTKKLWPRDSRTTNLNHGNARTVLLR